jgi:ferritin
MLSQVIQDALNKQINMEFSSSYSYLAMSAYCELKNFIGSASWMKIQSQEENAHAMKLYDFLIARGCPIKFAEISEQRSEFESVPHVFQQALKQEHAVSESIDALYELAHREKAFATLVELQWFITEQVEEEKTIREIVAKFDMVKDDPSALLDLDRELGTRPPEDAVADTAA